MKVLVACEFSGIVREAFRKRGHDAWSCDLIPAADKSPYHIQDDVLDHLGGWDLMIAHPPCTHLCSSGARWWPKKLQEQREAIFFVQSLWNEAIPKLCIENPVGILSTELGKPSQMIQPYEFGEDASKRTCLWLKGLEPLRPTGYVEGRKVERFPNDPTPLRRWGNQTDSGQNKLGPSEERSALRSITYQGIADAMASQWG